MHVYKIYCVAGIIVIVNYFKFDDLLYYEIEELKSGWHCAVMDSIMISSNNLCKVLQLTNYTRDDRLPVQPMGRN